MAMLTTRIERFEKRLTEKLLDLRQWIYNNTLYGDEYALLLTDKPAAIAEALAAGLHALELKYGASSLEAQKVREQLEYLKESIPSPGASISM